LLTHLDPDPNRWCSRGERRGRSYQRVEERTLTSLGTFHFLSRPLRLLSG
jgi:hypothetical protein